MTDYVKVDCSSCLQCCHFHFYQGKELTYKRLHDSFFFTRELCDTFFKKRADRYLVGDCCRHYSSGRCSVHDSPALPAICALFPIMLVLDKKGEELMAIDRNCPQWRVVEAKLKDSEYKNRVISLVEHFIVEGRAEFFSLDELLKCGYDLQILD